MELTIKHPNTSELFLLKIDVCENENESIYKVSFVDKRLSAKYGTVEIKRKTDNFWKLPNNADTLLKELLFQITFQIMDDEAS